MKQCGEAVPPEAGPWYGYIVPILLSEEVTELQLGDG